MKKNKIIYIKKKRFQDNDQSDVVFSEFVTKINRKFKQDPRLHVLTKKNLYLFEYTVKKKRAKTKSTQPKKNITSERESGEGENKNIMKTKNKSSWTRKKLFT